MTAASLTDPAAGIDHRAMRILAGWAEQSPDGAHRPLVAVMSRDARHGGGCSADGVLALLADGVEDTEAATEAARLVIEALRRGEWWHLRNQDLSGALLTAVAQVNQLVCRWAVRQPTDPDAQQQVTVGFLMLLVNESGAQWIAAGDVRLYLLRGGTLIALTRDLPRARRQRRTGPGAAPDPAACVPPQVTPAAIVSGLGRDRLPDLDRSLAPFPLRAGDTLLLCNQGLLDALGTARIAATLRFDPQAAADELLALAERPGAMPAARLRVAVLGLRAVSDPLTSAGLRGHRGRQWPRPLAAILALALAVVTGTLVALLVRPEALPQGATVPESPAPQTAPRAVASAGLTRTQVEVAATVSPTRPASVPSELPPRPLQYRDLAPAGD